MSAVLVPVAEPTASTFRQYSIRRGDGIAGLTLAEHRRRALAPDEVRVRIRAVALNYRDLMVARGQAGAAGRSIIPASDAAGEVIEVGSAAGQLAIGDRVVSVFFPDWIDGLASDDATTLALGGSMDGVLAEEVVLPARAWVRMPKHLEFAEAATISCAGVTAWHGVLGLSPVPAGGWVALLGTGSVSVWALQLAKAAGLRVVITSSDDRKLDRARSLGADATVNYRTFPEWGERIRELTGGRGVDRVLDIGGPDTIGQSIRALRTGGSAAIIGRLSGSEPARFDPAELFAGGKSLVGMMVGSRAMTVEMASFVERHRVRPVIDRTFGFGQAVEAYQYLADAQHFGKVVISIDS